MSSKANSSGALACSTLPSLLQSLRDLWVRDQLVFWVRDPWRMARSRYIGRVTRANNSCILENSEDRRVGKEKAEGTKATVCLWRTADKAAS